jgi:hypothetical protein
VDFFDDEVGRSVDIFVDSVVESIPPRPRERRRVGYAAEPECCRDLRVGVSWRVNAAYESPVISMKMNARTIARKESGAGCHAG